MSTHLLRGVFVYVMAGFFIIPICLAQKSHEEPQESSVSQEPHETRDSNESKGIRRDTDREREQQWHWSRDSFHFNPEYTEYRIERKIERDIKRYASTYELSKEQTEAVRQRFQELKLEAMEYMKSVREQRARLGKEMHDLWQQSRNGEQVDENRMKEVREQLARIFQNTPLINPRNATKELEKLLPPQQVAKGRQREVKQMFELEQRRDTMNWLNQLKTNTRDFPGQSDWWDSYVESYIRGYKLDESQQAGAFSILRSLKQDRDRYRESKRDDYLAAANNQDIKERTITIGKLNEPLDRLFDELRTRLDWIPTAAQKDLATGMFRKTTTTQPAYVATQPAETTTKSAGDPVSITERANSQY